MNCLFEIKRNAVGRYYFVFKNADGKMLVVSKSFLDRSSLEACLSEIRKNAKLSKIVDDNDAIPTNPLFQISCNREGEYLFYMIGMNGEFIMYSETYEKKEDCIRSIELFQENSLDAKIADLS